MGSTQLPYAISSPVRFPFGQFGIRFSVSALSAFCFSPSFAFDIARGNPFYFIFSPTSNESNNGPSFYPPASIAGKKTEDVGSWRLKSLIPFIWDLFGSRKTRNQADGSFQMLCVPKHSCRGGSPDRKE